MHFTEVLTVFSADIDLNILQQASDLQLKGVSAFVLCFDEFFDHDPRDAIVGRPLILVDDDKPEIREDDDYLFGSLIFNKGAAIVSSFELLIV